MSACASSPPTPTPPAAAQQGLRIKLTTVYVDDQDKALRFYTEVLGFVAKDDFSNGPFRWLTVSAPADPGGGELQLALADNPAAKAFQQAMFTQGQPAVMFQSTDVRADAERIKARGGTLASEPTEVMPGVVILTLADGCGNLVQVSQVPTW